jgi:small subunit ribosomal protein SAe
MAAEGGGAKALSQREQDIQMMLAADVHLGTKNCDFQMERYVYKRRTDGTYLILFFLLVEITDLSVVLV